MTTLDTLIRERIPDGRYALYWCASEDEHFPNGEESASGYVMVPNGKSWFFWTDWDAERQCERFDIWEPAAIQDSHRFGEYADACAKLGIPVGRQRTGPDAEG